MVDVKIQTQGQRMRDRMIRLRKQRERPGLRVEPTGDNPERVAALRRHLKHIPSGVGFRSEGSAEWPDDTFTRRRIRDGDIKIVEEKKAPPAKPQPRDAA